MEASPALRTVRVTPLHLQPVIWVSALPVEDEVARRWPPWRLPLQEPSEGLPQEEDEF